MHIRIVLAVAAMLLLSVACDSTGPDEDELEVSITVQSQHPWIRELDGGERRIECAMTFVARATGPEGTTAIWGTGERRWYTGSTRDEPMQVDTLALAQVRDFWQTGRLDAGATATTNWTFWAPMAYVLEQDFDYEVGGRVRTASVRQGCGIDVDTMGAPPVVSDVVIEMPDTIQSGDRFRVAFRSSADAWLWESRIEIRGAYEDTVIFSEQLASEATHDRLLTVPAGVDLGRSIVVSVLAVDALGRRSPVVSHESRPVVDLTPPSIDFVRVADDFRGGAGPSGRGQWAVGDTMHLSIAATDNHSADVIRVRVGTDAFLLAYRGLDYSDVINIPVRPEWLGAPAISFTVIDEQGLESAPYHISAESYRFFPAMSYPSTSSWTISGSIVALAWDDTRNRLYAATDAAEVVVLSTPSLVIERRIPLPDVPAAVDFNAAGDTIIVTFPSRGSLALIDLQTNVLHEVAVSADGDRPTSARLLADGTAIVVLIDDIGFHRAAVVDPANGAVVAEVTDGVEDVDGIARSRDGSLAVARLASCLHSYRPEAHAFGACIGAGWGYGSLTMDDTGDRILDGPMLVDLASGTRANVVWGVPEQLNYATAFGGDNASFFLAEPRGIVRIRESDGVILERFAHPGSVYRVLVSADGTGILTLGGSEQRQEGHVVRHLTGTASTMR